MINVLKALGVTVVEVAGMRDWVCWVASQHVGLVREGLCEEDRAAAIDWLTVQAFQE